MPFGLPTLAADRSRPLTPATATATVAAIITPVIASIAVDSDAAVSSALARMTPQALAVPLLVPLPVQRSWLAPSLAAQSAERQWRHR